MCTKRGVGDGREGERGIETETEKEVDRETERGGVGSNSQVEPII